MLCSFSRNVHILLDHILICSILIRNYLLVVYVFSFFKWLQLQIASKEMNGVCLHRSFTQRAYILYWGITLPSTDRQASTYWAHGCMTLPALCTLFISKKESTLWSTGIVQVRLLALILIVFYKTSDHQRRLLQEYTGCHHPVENLIFRLIATAFSFYSFSVRTCTPQPDSWTDSATLDRRLHCPYAYLYSSGGHRESFIRLQ